MAGLAPVAPLATSASTATAAALALRTRFTLLATSLALALAPHAAAAEPPEREGLACTATSLATAEGLRLEVVFANTANAPLTLPAGAHLALYRDAAATDPFEATARVDRLQRTALVVPPGGRATALLIADPRQAEELLCGATRPAAAALYFYEFSRRPTFRCVLKGEALAGWPKKPPCPPAGARRGEEPPRR